MRRILWAVMVILAGAVAAAAAVGIRWNASASVAPGLYVERARRFERGDLVAVCLPESVGRWAVGRRYLGRGGCPGGSATIGKRIAAVSGDTVEVRETSISVNGSVLSGSRRETCDSEGRPVPLVPEGEITVGPTEVWLHSGRHGRSLDSRIFGPLAVERIQSVMEPLWVVAEKRSDGR